MSSLALPTPAAPKAICDWLIQLEPIVDISFNSWPSPVVDNPKKQSQLHHAHHRNAPENPLNAAMGCYPVCEGKERSRRQLDQPLHILKEWHRSPARFGDRYENPNTQLLATSHRREDRFSLPTDTRSLNSELLFLYEQRYELYWPFSMQRPLVGSGSSMPLQPLPE